MKFEELTDEEWELIKPLLPPPTPTGRPRADDRKTTNAILYVLTTGCKWMDMPGEYGSYVVGGVFYGNCQFGMHQDGAEGFEMSSQSKQPCNPQF